MNGFIFRYKTLHLFNLCHVLMEWPVLHLLLFIFLPAYGGNYNSADEYGPRPSYSRNRPLVESKPIKVTTPDVIKVIDDHLKVGKLKIGTGPMYLMA